MCLPFTLLKGVVMARIRVQESILKIMHNRIGLHMTISEVTDLVDMDRKQVTQGLLLLSQKGLIHKMSQGIYMYNPSKQGEDGLAPQKTDHVWETMGTLKNGITIARNEDLELAAVIPLDEYLANGGK